LKVGQVLLGENWKKGEKNWKTKFVGKQKQKLGKGKHKVGENGGAVLRVACCTKREKQKDGPNFGK